MKFCDFLEKGAPRIPKRPAMTLPPYPLPELTVFWDPRPESEARTNPILGACNLPLGELDSRVAELPPKHEAMWIAASGALAESAADKLAKLERKAEIIPPESVPPRPPEPLRMWRPNAFLEGLMPALEPAGRALDLGCGAGREALLMASWGWQVTAADVLPDALEIGKDLERRYLDSRAPKVDWRCVDLEVGNAELGGPFGLVTTFRYLNRPLLKRIQDLLTPGGSFVAETFTVIHRERFGKPKSDAFVLNPGELPGLASGLRIEVHREGWHDGAHTARLWARSPS